MSGQVGPQLVRGSPSDPLAHVAGQDRHYPNEQRDEQENDSDPDRRGNGTAGLGVINETPHYLRVDELEPDLDGEYGRQGDYKTELGAEVTGQQRPVLPQVHDLGF